jgi:hypothetical protein
MSTALGVLVDLGLHVSDVNRSPVEYSPPRGRPPDQRGALADGVSGNGAFVGGDAQLIRIDLEDRGVEGIAERAAFAATAANTGWTSAGELAMTRRISAVAACCSRASLRALVSSEYDDAGGRRLAAARKRRSLQRIRGRPACRRSTCS